MNYSIRIAHLNDITAWQELSKKTFTQTFGHLYAAEDLHYFLETSYSIHALTEIFQQADTILYFVENNHKELLGYILAGQCHLPHSDVQTNHGEIKRLYLDNSLHNQGVGHQLMMQVINDLNQRNISTIWVGVWSENFGAQRFYSRYGFEKVGEYYFPVGKTKDLEFIYRLNQNNK